LAWGTPLSSWNVGKRKVESGKAKTDEKQLRVNSSKARNELRIKIE